MTTAADIKALIEARIEDTTIADKILEVLRPFDGKPISKRIATAVEKALPAYRVYYNTNYGMFHLEIWGNGIDHNDRKSFLLGYHRGTGATFNAREFEIDRNTCHYAAARERNAKRHDLMVDDVWCTKVALTINALNSEIATYESLVEWDNPDRYDIKKLIGEMP